jgi:hypothetical protein
MPIDTHFRPRALGMSRVEEARRFVQAPPSLREYAAALQRNLFPATG